MKPDLVAPGVRIAAARSTPRGEAPPAGIAVKSGTSMAAPHVAGTVAVMFEAHGRPLDILDTRALLLASADRPSMEDEDADPYRVGTGFLNPVAAERRTCMGAGRERGGRRELASADRRRRRKRPLSC